MKHERNIFIVLLTIIFCLGSALALAEDASWIDVRSQAEWEEDHIAGLPLLPHGSIADEIDKLNLDKDAPIKLFCRSGNRAGIAKQSLEALGYSNVKNVGSIEDARRLRAEP